MSRRDDGSRMHVEYQPGIGELSPTAPHTKRVPKGIEPEQHRRGTCSETRGYVFHLCGPGFAAAVATARAANGDSAPKELG